MIMDQVKRDQSDGILECPLIVDLLDSVRLVESSRVGVVEATILCQLFKELICINS